MGSRKFWDPEVFKNRPPDRVLEHFLYHSGLFWAVCSIGFTEIFWKGRNLKKISKNKFANFQIFNPNINIIILILGLKIWKLANLFLLIFFKFRPFQKISVNPMEHTAQNNPEWYRKCSKTRSGGRFLNTSGSQNLREPIFLSKTSLF